MGILTYVSIMMIIPNNSSNFYLKWMSLQMVITLVIAFHK